MPHELLAEILIVFVADLNVNFGKGDIGAFYQLFCFLNAQIIDIIVDSHSELFRKQAVEIVEGNTCALCYLCAGKFAVIIEIDVVDCLAQIFDTAVQGILLRIKIFTDREKNGGNEQINEIVVFKLCVFQAFLQFMEHGGNVSGIGKLNYFLFL